MTCWLPSGSLGECTASRREECLSTQYTVAGELRLTMTDSFAGRPTVGVCAAPCKGYAPAGYWWAGLGTIPALSRDETTPFYRNQPQASKPPDCPQGVSKGARCVSPPFCD